jgi:DNA-binding NtrC family response regulator
MTVQRILLIDDDPRSREILTTSLQGHGYSLLATASGEEGLERIGMEHPDLVVCNLRSGTWSTAEFSTRLHNRYCDLPQLLIVPRAAEDDALATIKDKTAEVLVTPTSTKSVVAAVKRVAQTHQQNQEATYLRGQACSVEAPPFVVESDDLRDVLRSAARIARVPGPVLITGETGTGKGRLAEYVHQASFQAGHAFIRIDCAAFGPTGLESELFGHERCPESGVNRQRAGCFELAEGGTLLLEEVGVLPPRIQARLLRVLKCGEYERVGGTGTLITSARIIATSSRDLPAAIAADEYREDLYYKLHTHPLHITPLRERPTDILPQAYQVALGHSLRHSLPEPEFTAEFEQCLLSSPWPGNTRELEQVVELAACTANGSPFTKEHLPQTGNGYAAGELDLEDSRVATALANHTMADVERIAILATLDCSRGNKTEAARRLGLTARTLSNKMKIWRQAGLVA